MDDMRMGIELVGRQTLVIQCGSALKDCLVPDQGRLVPSYIECDDVLLDGESVRARDAIQPNDDQNGFPLSGIHKAMGWRLLDPAKKIRIPFFVGEFSDNIEASNSPRE